MKLRIKCDERLGKREVPISVPQNGPRLCRRRARSRRPAFLVSHQQHSQVAKIARAPASGLTVCIQLR